MNYSRIYDSLINRAKSRVLSGFVEVHHIVPVCMGGSDDIDNLVQLTPEEHFIAHLLLVKIFPSEPKLVIAARMMTFGNSNHNRKSNKMYGWLKKKFREVQSKLAKERPSNTKGLIWVTVGETSKRIKKEDFNSEIHVLGRCKSDRDILSAKYNRGIRTNESKERLSLSLKKAHSDGKFKDAYIKIREKVKGQKRTFEQIERNRIAQTGRKHSEETKSKMSASHKGKHVSEETRTKMSIARKNIAAKKRTMRNI